MIQPLSFSHAECVLIDANLRWDGTQARSEGWDIFNLHDDLTCGIERIDEDARFTDDDHATAFITAQHTEYHDWALRIHHAADSIRFHTWGPDWVDSRCGPQLELA